MTVRMENIDELRRRTNVSYEAAKDALEKCNDDLLEAIVYLEKQNMVKPNADYEKKSSFWDKVKRIIKKGNNTKFIIHKRGSILLSVPVTLAVIVGILAPHITLISLAVVILIGYRIRFESADLQCKKVNEMMDKAAEGVDSLKRKMTDYSTNEVKAD